MQEHNFYISHLIAKYLAEKINKDELEELNLWREKSEANEELFRKITDSGHISDYYSSISQVNVDKQWNQFSDRRAKMYNRRKLRRILGYAASLLIPLSIGLTIYFTSRTPIVEDSSLFVNTIQIGNAKAILKLSEGEVIHLTDEDTLQLDEDLSLLAHSSSGNSATDQVQMNSIETPRGGEYALTLSDGTKVFLNSMSTLVFPSEFSGEERRVELYGEAYFEVSKSSAPFIVTTSRADIQVLGTSFNVYNYEGEAYEAALVSGSIAISTSQEKMILNPSQRATIHKADAPMVIDEIDALSISEWHKGKIVFKDQSLEYMMNRLARWYDFSVEYKSSALKNLRFSCSVDKYEDIAQFLQVLESTDKLKAEINGKAIYLK